MTPKTPARKGPAREATTRPADPMETAYQVHTLAQMLYGQMAQAHPWAPPHPMATMGPVQGVPFHPAQHAWPTAWPQAGPPTAGAPFPGPHAMPYWWKP